MPKKKNEDRESSEFFVVEHIDKSERAFSDESRQNMRDGQLSSLSRVLKDFRKIHGNRYDYSKVDYQGAKTKVTIICKEHGEFQQQPRHHLKGTGCRECIRKAKEVEILGEFRKTHGDRYDYSKVDYQDRKTKVIIICKEHGEFQLLPSKHYKGLKGKNPDGGRPRDTNGRGCPKCARLLRNKKFTHTTDEVLENFRKTHGDRYDYSKVDYKNAQTKVIIICREHGEFLQTPSSHKKGRGCRKCRTAQRLEKQSSNKSYFLKLTYQERTIKSFREVHGYRFFYNKVNYRGHDKTVRIICRKQGHGGFRVLPQRHRKLVDGGCPRCKKERSK
jgi:hypothetical protein